jgi:CRP-like cAMP-binding protein
MPSTNNVLDQARDLVKKRLAELDDERKRLERALAELGGSVPQRPGRQKGSGRGPGRPPKAVSSTASTPRKRRRRRGGTRADQAVKLVEQKPGISASEISQQLKIKPNYLYRVLGELEKEGQLTKKGREYHPASS